MREQIPSPEDRKRRVMEPSFRFAQREIRSCGEILGRWDNLVGDPDNPRIWRGLD
jgi:hypothetical protein